MKTCRKPIEKSKLNQWLHGVHMVACNRKSIDTPTTESILQHVDVNSAKSLTLFSNPALTWNVLRFSNKIIKYTITTDFMYTLYNTNFFTPHHSSVRVRVRAPHFFIYRNVFFYLITRHLHTKSTNFCHSERNRGEEGILETAMTRAKIWLFKTANRL